MTGRTPIRTVKIGAIALATVGLAILWFTATHADVPIVTINQISATMNLAYVRIAGRCTQTPTYNPEDDYLSFWLTDGTGEIYVAAYRATTRDLIEHNRVPALGDQIEVAGTLRVQEDFLSLTIEAPEQLLLSRPEAEERPIAAITPADQHRRVQVRGQIRETYEPYEGLTLLTIHDGTDAIPIVVSEDLIALSGITPTMEMGQTVEVEAAVSLYKSKPQLVPASTADIVPIEQVEQMVKESPIGELSSSDVGRLVAIQGTINAVETFSGSVKLRLDDGSGSIVLLLWQDIYEQIPHTPTTGAVIHATGKVSQYQGQLEVIPEMASEVAVFPAASTPSSATSIGDVTRADVGRTLTLRGTLSNPETFSHGVKFTLEDETGAIVLLLWQEIYEALPDAERFRPGIQIEVQGEIEEYQGDLEIIPPVDGVTVIE
jgi:DNA/RNA endonuclease YhcR with UshA esterase domain